MMDTYEGKDSDLKVLDSVCKYYDIPSIIGFDRSGVPYVRGYEYELNKEVMNILSQQIQLVLSYRLVSNLQKTIGEINNL